MSYELDHVEQECPCPCGKGRIVCGSGSNDWNQTREGMIEIWCGECSKQYRFSKGGLLPIDFPEYKGDEKAYEEMYHLKDIIANYRGYHAFRYWSDELRKKRINSYLTTEEIEEDKKAGVNHNLVMALRFAKGLADKYSLDELKEAQHQLKNNRFSTQLTGVASEITSSYKLWYKSVKVSNVIIPVNMAIRNYEVYKEANKEDDEYIAEKKEELKKVEAVYYKDFEEYEVERKKHLIKYQLVDV